MNNQYLSRTVTLGFVFLLILGETASAQEISSQPRELKVKVVIDDSFHKKALREIEGMQMLVKLSYAELESLGVRNARKVNQWNFSTPEDLATGIIQKVSELYEKRFDISLQITELERVHFEHGDKIIFDYHYMDLLNRQSCSGAEILIGFTAKILYSSEKLFTPSDDSKNTVRGTAQPLTGRMFTVLSFWGWPPESFEKIVENIDHELAHIFGANHKPGMQYDGKVYLEEAAEAIRRNRLKIFTCPEPASITE